jgi:hypothetical protein
LNDCHVPTYRLARAAGDGRYSRTGEIFELAKDPDQSTRLEGAGKLCGGPPHAHQLVCGIELVERPYSAGRASIKEISAFTLMSNAMLVRLEPFH